MKTFLEWIKVIIAFVVMVGSGIAPTICMWYWLIRESLSRPDLTVPYIVAGVIAMPAIVMLSIMVSSAIGGFFIRYWGPK